MKKSYFKFEILGNIEIECRRNMNENTWKIKAVNNNTGKEETIGEALADNEAIKVIEFVLHKEIPKGKKKALDFLKKNIKRIKNNSSIICQNMKSTLSEQNTDTSELAPRTKEKPLIE